MSPQFLRIILTVLVVRAIFLSPVQGSEFGSADAPRGSSLKRLESIRPSRLRFTNPREPSAVLEQLDCIDGGDDGDGEERFHSTPTSLEPWPSGSSFHPIFPDPNRVGALFRGFVRLRC
jgi:ABC-type cobalt transport system substrate-binding protein